MKIISSNMDWKKLNTLFYTKASDMELLECRVDSVYDDEIEYTYWIEQQIYNEEFRPTNYKTLYIECEEDTDGWITCRLYYKDDLPDGARETY